MTKPMIGDRVRFKEDLGGHLKKGRIGLVVEIDPMPEDGSKPDLNLHVAVSWIREDAPNDHDTSPWDGKVKGIDAPAVVLSQFHQGFVIPMSPSELTLIDNVGSGSR